MHKLTHENADSGQDPPAGGAVVAGSGITGSAVAVMEAGGSGEGGATVTGSGLLTEGGSDVGFGAVRVHARLISTMTPAATANLDAAFLFIRHSYFYFIHSMIMASP
jgi:hypothetical protein